MPASVSIVDDETRKLWRQATRAELFAHYLPALLGREDGGGGFTIPVAAWPGYLTHLPVI